MVRSRERRRTDRWHFDARRGDRSRRGADPRLRRRFRVRNGFGGQAGGTGAERRGCPRGAIMMSAIAREHTPERTRWAVVVAFAIAMAWVEAASVFYIRLFVDRIEPYQPDPLPINGMLGNVELWREAATLVMLATLGMLAGHTWRRRAGY